VLKKENISWLHLFPADRNKTYAPVSRTHSRDQYEALQTYIKSAYTIVVNVVSGIAMNAINTFVKLVGMNFMLYEKIGNF